MCRQVSAAQAGIPEIPLILLSALRAGSLTESACFSLLSQILQKGDITGLLTWEYYVESELQEHIEKAIRQLPPQCQKIFIMNRFNDKSITQIAEELEISPRTVEKHIEIALKKLRQELADYLPAGLLLWLLNI